MMANCIDLRSGLIDCAMNDALRIKRHRARRDRLRIEIELKDVVRAYAFGGNGPGQIEPCWIVGVTETDMSERVQNALAGQNKVRSGQGHLRIKRCHLGTRWCGLVILSVHV